MSNILRVSRTIAGQEIVLETGRMAFQANGAVSIQHGDTMVLSTAVMSEKGDPSAGFFRLTMEYQERFYAAGKIKGSRFIKRDGRSSEMGILKARLMDRPIRPLFPKGITNEVQGIATVLSADLVNEPGILALNSMSAAMMIGGLPFAGPVGAVRIGMIDGQLIVFPTMEQTATGDLDLVVAGTADAITMVEAGSNEVNEEMYLKALQLAHDVIKELCALQMELFNKINPTMLPFEVKENDETAYEAVKAFLTKADLDTITGLVKADVKAKLHVLEDKVMAQFAAQIEDGTYSKGELMDAIMKLFEKNMRVNVLTTGVRLDGRGLSDIRPIHCEVGLIPRTHGSALFQRGETQALTLTTLGGPGDAQIVDTMDEDGEKRYIHYYNFPPFSTGEAKMLRGSSRREIGHGALAERALMPVLPDKKEFAYTMLLVSEIMTCNGSSSMASVCGSSLSLMDAGVPIKKPVAGIAMGLVCSDEFKETGQGGYALLSDIQGQEDFAGDMDFKVTGTDTGVTALQMDIKVKGITLAMMHEALEKAKAGRMYIMGKMNEALSAPRPELNQFAPMIMNIKINPEQIRDVIGKGGETIQKITAECGVQIDIDQEGIVIITAPDQESGNKAKEWVERITYVPKAGEIFDGTVKTIMDFGAFVEFVPGRDGLVHVSEMRPYRVNNVADVVKEGDKVKVRLMEVDGKGRYNLTMKEFYDGPMPGGDRRPEREERAPREERPPREEQPQPREVAQAPKAESIDDIDLDAPFAF